MLRVDGFYLYQVGYQIHPLSKLRAPSGSDPGTETDDALGLLAIAEGALDRLLTKSVFRLRTSSQAGGKLLAAVKETRSRAEAAVGQGQHLNFVEVLSITNALTEFEAVFGAELAIFPLYGITRKAGFDLPTLIENGAACFPAEICSKAPEALPDLQQATKCIAFELFTAAGFHLHRANEAVLRRYWDAVTNGATRPASRNMGDYLNGLNNLNAGNTKVKAALKDLKDLHRNPLIHPEESLDNVDEAVALMNGVHTAVLNMLKEMPVIATIPPPTPVGSIPPPP
jgi:hypothetical protein